MVLETPFSRELSEITNDCPILIELQLQFLPSILCLAPLPFIPESPRWLVYQDRHDEARAMLVKYHGNGDPNSTLVAVEFEEIRQTLEFEKSVQKTEMKALVATKANRRRIGIAIAVGGKSDT